MCFTFFLFLATGACRQLRCWNQRPACGGDRTQLRFVVALRGEIASIFWFTLFFLSFLSFGSFLPPFLPSFLCFFLFISSGGGLAQIVGAKLKVKEKCSLESRTQTKIIMICKLNSQVPAFSFSGPGLLTSRAKFNISRSDLYDYVVNIVPTVSARVCVCLFVCLFVCVGVFSHAIVL